MRSVVVVLPASTWAMMPILRISASGVVRGIAKFRNSFSELRVTGTRAHAHKGAHVTGIPAFAKRDRPRIALVNGRPGTIYSPIISQYDRPSHRNGRRRHGKANGYVQSPQAAGTPTSQAG